ncbi:MAG: CoA-binding protein [Actinobacteria bacterium]|uniref:Unannotated protein n=1 Tax=freshwater metagenome TaxID=449393 RepID=A0A6J7KFR7_9ZZZZ|nr:CoA-binding protein [Actinomycetota bacterium]
MPRNLAARRRLTSSTRLGALFGSRRIAIVGASESSSWAGNLLGSLRRGGGVDDVHFVHPKYPELFGQATVPTMGDLPTSVDLAFIMVGPGKVEQILSDAASVGVHSAVVLAAGYGELGDEGRQLQADLVDLALGLDITVLGPNTIGFINASLGISPWAVASHSDPIKGPVSAVFESGSMARATYEFAQAHGIGTSLWASVGNSAVVNSLDVLEYLIEDEGTRAIALFLETVREPERFMALATHATRAGKPVVAFKAGRSEEGARSAMAHTGAMATDDAVVDAAFRQSGVVRVESVEDLISTVGLLAYTRRLPRGRRMGVVTSSGGGCNIIADLAEKEGLALPEWQPETEALFRTLLPPFAHVLNPLDTTGFGHARSRPRPTKAEDDLMEMAATDSGVDFIYSMMTPLPATRPEDPTWIESRMEIIGGIVEQSPVPIILSSNTCLDIAEYPRQLLADNGLFLLPGADLALKSIGAMARWTEQRDRLDHRPSTRVAVAPFGDAHPVGVWAEDEGRGLVSAAGVAIVPARLATSATEAIEAARDYGYPVVMKVCSRDIPHKTDVGGVLLNVASADEVARGYDAILSSCLAGAPAAAIRGVLISPMRPPGLDLLVGVTVDPNFGPVVAVGLGGIWVETLADSSLRVLPITADEVRTMLGELKGSSLLQGARGSKPVDIDALSHVVVAVAEAALSLGDRLEALEVNPLRVTDTGIEALDVLVSTRGVDHG